MPCWSLQALANPSTAQQRAAVVAFKLAILVGMRTGAQASGSNVLVEYASGLTEDAVTLLNIDTSLVSQQANFAYCMNICFHGFDALDFCKGLLGKSTTSPHPANVDRNALSSRPKCKSSTVETMLRSNRPPQPGIDCCSRTRIRIWISSRDLRPQPSKPRSGPPVKFRR